MRRWATLVVALLAVAMLHVDRLHADTYPRQTGFTIARYSFDLTIGDASNEIAVTDTVDVLFTAAGVTAIDLDLCGVKAQRAAGAIADPCMGRGAGAAGPGGGGLSGAANTSATPTGMTVTAVTSGGQPLRFTHENDRLHVTFPASSQAGARFSFTVTYHGTPSTGLQIGNNRYGDRGFFSNDWPQLARNWLATIDHPSMKAATSMTVTAPRKYQVISNGRMIEATDLPNDLRRTARREDTPVASWQFSLGVAPFAVSHFGEFRGIPLSAWVYPQERDDSFKGFGDYTQPILEFYIDHIGPYSYEKLAQVEATTVSGGMELASDIFYGYRGVPGRQLIAHEMAHQWFGDSATEKDWDDVWLSEGFATYFALLYQEHADGREAFVAGVRSSAQSAIRYALANPTSTVVHQNLADISRVIANNAQIYQGGAQVLHMLRGVLGDNRFWAGIRLYYQRHRNANATTDDLRHAMEDACMNAGNCPDEDKDLAWFFHEWLNRGGILQLNGNWHYDAAAKQVTVTLDQMQTTGLYRMPIEIRVIATPPAAGAGGRGGAAAAPPTRLMLDQAHQTLSIPSATEPVDVQLDPQSWLTMMQATFVKR
jgi:aminopeptidase N